MQKPFGGKFPEQGIGREAMHPVVFGHTHRWNHATVPKIGINANITVTNVGSATPYGYTPKYTDGAITCYTYGIADLRLKKGPVESASFVFMSISRTATNGPEGLYPRLGRGRQAGQVGTYVAGA